jgi:hypothetical protein
MTGLAAGPTKKNEKTDEERLAAVLNHPLFMDSFTKDEDMEHDTLEAIRSLVYDGTPQGIAY